MKPIVFLFLFACSSNPNSNTEIRFLVESSPATLNPRQTLDAIGQRIQILSFRALTSLDTELNPVPDLSEKWRFLNSGRQVRFQIKSGQTDHRGKAIDSTLIYECLQNYLYAIPASPHRSSFPLLKSITKEKDEIIFNLEAPDPYLPKNLSVLRYFSTEQDPSHPCLDPKQTDTIVTNGLYKISPYLVNFDRRLLLLPMDRNQPNLVIELVRDETSRLLKLLNGEANAVLNSFSPTKMAWIASNPSKGFKLIEREGTNASYLAFNLRDPILSKKSIRLAIGHAIDRETIVKHKLKTQASLASSFLNPTLPEAISTRPFTYDPALSEKLLDEANYPRGADGVRFRLKYKTTTNREGLELAQVFQEMLKKVGIQIDLDPVEPSVFFASIRKKNFQMYMSRWIGVSDGSIFERTLHSGNKDNRVGYQDALTDEWLKGANQELDPEKRRALLVKVQERMLDELPYFPLWHWSNSLLIKNTLTGVEPRDVSLSGSFISLTKLRFSQ